jgi:predicted metal-dependent peptidase
MEEEKQEEVIKPTQENVDKVAEALTISRMKFVADNAFIGSLLIGLDAIVSDSKIPIAAVNYTSLYVNGTPEDKNCVPFYEFDDIGKRTVIAHEIYHLIFEHLDIPIFFNHQIANIAQDAVINRCIQQDSNYDLSKLPDGIVMPITSGSQQGFTVGKEKKFFKVDDINNLDWVPVYWAIMKQLEKECKGTPQQKAEAMAKAIKKLAGSDPMNGDTKDSGCEGDPTKSEDFKFKFRLKVCTAYQNAKSQGYDPAGIGRYVDALTEGKVPWTQYLRNLIKTEISKTDFSNKFNSRRAHLGRGQGRPSFFPRIENEALGNVYLILDTSGSMGDAEIRDGLSEFASLRQQAQFPLHFMACDAEAYEIQSCESWEEPDWTKLKIDGGGGTDFRPAFEAAEKHAAERGHKITLLTFFTDSYGTFPEQEPEYPVIWILNIPKGSGYNIPWGTVVSTVD